jgi:hypothetical protein
MSFIGGPTVFVEDADGQWWEYALPEGKRIENGDEITLDECQKIDKAYRTAPCPTHPKNGEAPTAEYLRALVEWRAIVESPDTRITFTGGRFVTLVTLVPVTP